MNIPCATMEGACEGSRHDEIDRYIDVLQTTLAAASHTRTRQVTLICLMLFLSCVVTIGAIARLISEVPRDYGLFSVTAAAVQVMLLIFVVLGLVLHMLTLGRITSILLGSLKVNVDLLERELCALGGERAASEQEGYRGQDIAATNVTELRTAGGSESSAKFRVVRSQLNSLLSEIRTIAYAVSNGPNLPDGACFSYGFAAICLFSSFVIVLGKTEAMQFLRVVLLCLGTVCALCCYFVLTRPTTAHSLVDQSLRKLGLSIEFLSDTSRAETSTLPPALDDIDVFDPVCSAIDDIADTNLHRESK